MRRLGGTTSGAIANLAAQGIPFLLLLLVTPFLLRHLGRDVYGALVLFNLVPQIAVQFDLGLVTAGTRAYAQSIARHDAAGARAVVQRVLGSLVAWGLLLGALLYLARDAIAGALRLTPVTDGHELVFLASALAIPIALTNSVALIPLRATERYGRAGRRWAASRTGGCARAARRTARPSRSWSRWARPRSRRRASASIASRARSRRTRPRARRPTRPPRYRAAASSPCPTRRPPGRRRRRACAR